MEHLDPIMPSARVLVLARFSIALFALWLALRDPAGAQDWVALLLCANAVLWAIALRAPQRPRVAAAAGWLDLACYGIAMLATGALDSALVPFFAFSVLAVSFHLRTLQPPFDALAVPQRSALGRSGGPDSGTLGARLAETLAAFQRAECLVIVRDRSAGTVKAFAAGTDTSAPLASGAPPAAAELLHMVPESVLIYSEFGVETQAFVRALERDSLRGDAAPEASPAERQRASAIARLLGGRSFISFPLSAAVPGLGCVVIMSRDTPLGTAGVPFLLRMAEEAAQVIVGSSRVDLQACKLEYSIVSPK